MYQLEGWLPYGYTEKWDEKDKYIAWNPLHGEERPLHLGIVGAGGVAQGKHFPALFRLGMMGYPVQVAAVAEINEVMRTKSAHMLGCRGYADYRDMLEQEQLDAIEVLMPPAPPRGDVIRLALEKGVHVLAEKPLLFTSPHELGTTLQEADRLCKLAEERGLVLSMGFSKRFSPPYHNARLLINDGRIGKIGMVQAKMCQGWSKANLLENQTCHMIDALRYLIGEVKRVYAVSVNRYGETAYPIDGLAATLEFENGAIGTLVANSSNPSLKPWERIEVFGERKWLAIEDGAELIVHDSDEGPSKVWKPVWPHTLLLDEQFSGFVGEIMDFAEAARGRRQPATTGRDGYKALEIAYALHRSYETGRVVELPMPLSGKDGEPG